MQDISKIKEQVEQRLQEQQANKDFKDIGRVAQTKKEKSAFRLINGSLLNQLEEDGVMAYNMVKKDAVWAEIDVQMERNKGVTSGAAYLKVKIREAVPTRPKDEKAKRATYVMFLELLQNDLLECFTVEQIKQLSNKYLSMPIDKIIGYFIDSSYLTADEETKLKIQAHLKTNSNLRLAMLYGGESLIKKLINEIFGARFENILFRISDAAYQVWNDAISKEPITEEQSKELVEKLEKSEKAFVESNDKKIEEYKLKSKEELWKSINTDWQIGSENKKRYKENTEWFRTWVVSYYEKRKEKGITEYKFKILLAQPKPNDWSWFESPKTKDSTEDKKPKEKAINTKEPLAYIKRTGGYKIENYSPKGIVDIFGFSAVNYGNYVDNAWSKDHTKHFLGAICDMAEMLNIDIKKANELGKLSIAFGAKGRKGHAAAYFPQTKDINLTKGNGDGSVAHEWGHYFDNVIVELDEKKATNNFASEGNMPDYEIKSLFKELFDFIYKGNDLYTPKIPILFYAEKSDKAPQYVVRNGYQSEQKTVVIKDTIEETLAELEKYAVIDKDWYYTQKRLFGYVIAAFGLETYNIPMKLKTSYFYHKTAYQLFQYCYKLDEKKIEIVVEPRTKYWISAVELFARAWETVILKKLLDKNRVSNYLVNDIPTENVVAEGYSVPYPMGKELEYIETLMDKIVAAVKRKFNIGDFVAPSYVLEDDYVELKKDESGKTEAAMVVDKVVDKKEIEFIKEDEVVKKIEKPIEDIRLEEIEKNIEESKKEEAEINATQDPTKRLSILKESLRKKEELFNQKIQEHFDTVRQTNGQPLNDKRNGQATLNKWERQNEAIRGIKEGIEKTKRAIEIEEGKIKEVAATKEYLPKQLLDAIDNGTIVQWRKHPNTFFVSGVDKARLVWDDKDKVLAYRYIKEVTDKDQYKKFAKTYNELYNAIKNNIDLGVKTEEIPKENIAEETPKAGSVGVGGDYYIKDGKEFKKVDNAKLVKLDTEGDFFAVKNDNGGYTIHEAKSGVAIDANSFHKTIKDAVNNANEKISKNAATIPLSRIIDGEIKRDGLSPRYSQNPKENTAVTDLLNEVNSGKINADDAAIKLDESGVEVSNEVYDQFREAEANFKKGKNGLQVGDTVTVKGKNGNPDFKGNFRGITKEGKYVVVGENGYQNVYEKSDIAEQSLKETPKEETISKKYNIGDEFMLGEDKVYIGENGAFGLNDEVCLYNSKDKSLVKCFGKNTFDIYVEQGKFSPIDKETDFEQFEKIVLESNTLEEAFNKVKEIKNVPYNVSVKFRETYDPNDELTPIQSFEKFYKKVKSKKIPQKVIDAFKTETKESNFSFINIDKKMWRRDNKTGEITNQGAAPDFTMPKTDLKVENEKQEDTLLGTKQTEMVDNIPQKVQETNIEFLQPKIGDILDFGDGLEEITRIVKTKSGQTFIEAKMIDGSSNRLNLYPIEDYEKIISNQDNYKQKREAEAEYRKQNDIKIEKKKEIERQKVLEYNDINGFADNETELKRGKILAYLNKSFFGNVTVKDEIRSLVKNGFVVDKNGKEQIRYIENGNEFILNDAYQTKTAIDYLKYLQQNEPFNFETNIKSKDTISIIEEAAKVGTKKVLVKFIPAYEHENHKDLPKHLIELLKQPKTEIFDVIEDANFIIEKLKTHKDVQKILWYYENETKNKIYKPTEVKSIADTKPNKFGSETKETKSAEPTNDNESILKKIKALQILANMGDESATKKVKALKLLIN